MPSVLVTGGAGFIGSHACKALRRLGYLPVAYDNLSRGHRDCVRWGPLVTGELEDRTTLDGVFAEHAPIAVMHFAALAYVGESVEAPLAYYRTNVAGSVALLEAMKQAGCDQLVFSSSCATYGIPQVLPIPESHPQLPISPYGRSKLFVEQMIADAGAATGLGCVTLRYFNAAGSDPDLETGEDHDPETHLIPSVLLAAAGQRPAITIFGDDYDTQDGTCIRDFVHVSDLADAHVLALKWLLAGKDSTSFNLGTGRGYSVREIVDAAKPVTQADIPVIVAPRRPGDPPTLVGDASRAQRELGWLPQRSSLEQLLTDSWRWMCHRFEGD